MRPVASSAISAAAGATAKSDNDRDQIVADHLAGLRDSISGVDTQEELTNLARFQNTSSAITKFVSSINDMLTNSHPEPVTHAHHRPSYRRHGCIGHAARISPASASCRNQVSSGLRVSKPSDDPAAWMTAQRDKVRAALNDGTSQAIEVGHERLVASDGALSSLGEHRLAGARARGRGRQRHPDGGGAHRISARSSNSLFDAAVVDGEHDRPDGEYLLAGTNSLAQPFDTTTGAYTGDARRAPINTDTTSTQVATVAGSGLTAANGVDILPLMKTLATAMNTNNTATIQSALGSLDTAVKQVAQLRGQTGAHMAVLESAKTAHDAARRRRSRRRSAIASRSIPSRPRAISRRRARRSRSRRP